MSTIEKIDPNWRVKYKTLKDFYEQEYNPEYFTFSKYELEVDPMEPMEEIEEYDNQRKRVELAKCAISFPYFCTKYVKITHPKKGLLPFILYKYQRRVIEEYEKYRFTILSKFRQGGLTTVTVIWCLWRCLFKLDETIMVLSKSDREAIAAGEIVKRALEELPSWMKPDMSKNNDHQKLFADTGCKLFFYTPEAARGRSITFLVLDEAAFIPQMDKHWKAMFPTISTGGHCICVSTVNGVGNWYYDMFMGAKKDDPENDFHIIELDYWEHPEYNDEEWVKSTRAQLGEKGWQQEVMRDFLGAGDSYIPNEIINDLDIQTRALTPLRMLFPKWNNLDEAREQRVRDESEWQRGALHIWREPVDGHEYIIGVDCAEGMGDENDNNCFSVIDERTCEQVAEFYSNTCTPFTFAQILAMTGVQYNNALIVVEALGPGLSVLERLQHDLFYPNIHQSLQGNLEGGKQRYGIKTTTHTRSRYLETMQTRIINNSVVLRSRRLVKELKGFIWNTQTRRAEASKGFHDDAIMALCFALYVKEGRQRNLPVGYDNPEDEPERFKVEMLEQIKKEFARNTEWDEDEKDDELEDLRKAAAIPPMLMPGTRKYDAILKEFFWTLFFAISLVGTLNIA